MEKVQHCLVNKILELKSNYFESFFLVYEVWGDFYPQHTQENTGSLKPKVDDSLFCQDCHLPPSHVFITLFQRHKKLAAISNLLSPDLIQTFLQVIEICFENSQASTVCERKSSSAGLKGLSFWNWNHRTTAKYKQELPLGGHLFYLPAQKAQVQLTWMTLMLLKWNVLIEVTVLVFFYQFWIQNTFWDFLRLFFFFCGENAQISKDIFDFWEWDTFRLGRPGYLGMFSL